MCQIINEVKPTFMLLLMLYNCQQCKSTLFNGQQQMYRKFSTVKLSSLLNVIKQKLLWPTTTTVAIIVVWPT